MENNCEKEVHLVKVVTNNHDIEVVITRPVIAKDLVKGSIYLIHGVAGQIKEWYHQVNYFVQRNWNLIKINLIGHGRSCKPKNAKDYEFKTLAVDVVFIFDTFIGTGQRIVVGHSYGCSIATYLATERKDNIHKLVLISGGSPSPLGSPPFLFTMCHCFLGCFHRIIIFEFRKKAFYGQKITGASVPEDRKIAVDINSFTLRAIMLGQIWDEGDEQYHSKIFIPTLLIHGLQDRFVSSDDEYEMLATLPIATLRTIDNAGHMVMLEQPDLVNKYIEEHIARDYTIATSLPLENNNAVGRKSRSGVIYKKTLPYKSQSKVTFHLDPKLNVFNNKVYPVSYDNCSQK